MIIAFDQIPVIDYGTPSTDEIHAGLDVYNRGCRAYRKITDFSQVNRW